MIIIITDDSSWNHLFFINIQKIDNGYGCEVCHVIWETDFVLFKIESRRFPPKKSEKWMGFRKTAAVSTREQVRRWNLNTM